MRMQEQVSVPPRSGERSPAHMLLIVTTESRSASATRLELRLDRAQLQEHGLSLVKVIDREVKVYLLRYGLVRPARGLIVIDPLETDAEPVPAGEPGEVTVGFVVEFEPGGLLIERGQCQWVGAVECYRR